MFDSLPRRATNFRMTQMKVSVVRSGTNSRWTAQVVAQVNRHNSDFETSFLRGVVLQNLFRFVGTGMTALPSFLGGMVSNDLDWKLAQLNTSQERV